MFTSETMVQTEATSVGNVAEEIIKAKSADMNPHTRGILCVCHGMTQGKIMSRIQVSAQTSEKS